jgi:hypothetical protein
MEQNQIIEDINPLDEVVNEKRYSQSNVNTEGVDFTKPIDEPVYEQPPFLNQNNTKKEAKKPDPINPEMNEMGKKEKELASSQAAKMIIQGYEWLHILANKGLKVSERKLNKMQANGEINLNAMIDYDYGKKIRAGEFFQEYNNQIDGILSVSEDFKEEVTPVLERVLAKRGIGMSDEQYLMYLFGKDIAGKTLIFIQQKAQVRQMIQSIKDSTASQPVFNETMYQPQAQPQPTPQPQTEQFTPQPPKDEPKEVLKAEPIYNEPEEKEVVNDFEPIKKRQRGRPKKS